MKLYALLALTTLSFLFTQHSNAQNKDAENYRKQSEETRKQVWGWQKPEFNVRVVPQQYSNTSKVIIAHHTDISADSKSKITLSVFGLGGYRALSVHEVVREMVKLNDKFAIDEYSELSFTKFQRSSGFIMDKKTTVYIGARVIKPNGSIKEINADDIILTKDEAKEKQAKIAIPDLQVGDILDYFIAKEQSMEQEQLEVKTYTLNLFDDAPILSLSFHAQLGTKYAFESRSYNGAPDLTITKGSENEIIADVEKKNIPPFERSLWVSPSRQLPIIRMNILIGYKGTGSKGLNARKPGEVFKNRDAEEYVQDLSSGLSYLYYSSYWMKAARQQFDDLVTEAKKLAKKSNLTYKDMSDDEKVALLYYTIRYKKVLDFNVDDMKSSVNIGDRNLVVSPFLIFATMKAAELDPALLISSGNRDVLNSELINKSDLYAVAYLPKLKNAYFDMSSIYNPAFTVPEQLEGVKSTRSLTFDHPSMIMSFNKMYGLSKIDKGPNTPESNPVANTHIENLVIGLSDDKSKLNIQRNTILKGNNKKDAQSDLILYEDMVNAERKSFNEEKTLIEELEQTRKTKKNIDEIRSLFAEARRKQKDAFTTESKEWFGQPVADVADYKIESLGIRHTAPDFSYSSKFSIDGLAKKAGNNILIEIGKMQGQIIDIKPEQRTRTLDIYMPFANSKELNIELQIPEGFTTEGIATLNKNVQNETGIFSAEATQKGNAISIKIKSSFLHNYEPVANWDKLLALIDAAREWGNTKILFKKK